MPSYTMHEGEPFLSDQNHTLERNPSNSSSEAPLIYSSPPLHEHASLHRIAKIAVQLFLCTLVIMNIVTLAVFWNVVVTQEASGQGQSVGTISSSNSAAAFFNLTMKTLQTTYGSDVSYMSLNHSYDWLWALDGSEHAGLIMLDPPNQDGSIQWGAITMFHQLHCLSSIRTALQRATSGEDIGVDYHHNAHWPHCLNYLRQGVLCHADDTVELPFAWEAKPPVDVDGASNETVWTTAKRVGSIDGSRDLRVCRDTDELFKVLAERGFREGMEV